MHATAESKTATRHTPLPPEVKSAIGVGLAAAAIAKYLGFTDLIALWWAAAGVAIVASPIALHQVREKAAAQQWARVIIVVGPPKPPDPEKPKGSWVLRTIVMIVGALLSLGAGTLIFGVAAHDRSQFDLLTVESNEYVLTMNVPVGTRSDQSVIIDASLQRRLPSTALPTTTPSLGAEAPAVVTAGLQPAAGQSANQVTYSWTFHGAPGEYVLSFDYGQPLFAQPLSVSGLTLPGGVPIADAGRRVQALQTGGRAFMTVYTELGLSTTLAAIATFVGAFAAFLVPLKGS